MVKQTRITFFVCFFGRIERLLRMCVLRMFNGMVMDQHSQDNQAEYTEDTQHNNHVPCSFSIARIKNNIIGKAGRLACGSRDFSFVSVRRLKNGS